MKAARMSLFALLALVVALQAGPVFAQDGRQAEEAERNWSNGTELGAAFVTGNANTGSFNLRNVYQYSFTGDKAASVYWETGWVRASSGDDRFAVGTEDDFEVVRPDVELDNNRLYSKFRYQRDLNERFYWYGSWDSTRDEPSNINRQFIVSGGAGNNWVVSDDLVFRTNYGVAYTLEDLDLEGENNFAGYRLFYHFEAQVIESTRVESELTFDGSVETTNDVRTDWYNAATVSMTDNLALKAGLRIIFRNVPALEDIDLDRGDGLIVGTVVVPKEKLDTNFTASLVISF